MRFHGVKILALCGSLFLPAVSAHAKSNSWWDCFFREFELCSGRVSDPDAPEPGASASLDPAAAAPVEGSGRGYCDGKARSACDDEEAKKTLKPGGRSANEVKGAKSTVTEGAKASSPADPSKPGDKVAPPAGGYFVEGNAPSGFKTVLGVDVTLPISEIAEAYGSRNVRGCRPIEDPFTRVLCLDALGASAGGAPIELEFYRGRLVALNYEAKPGVAVKFRPAVSVAEENTGARAAISSLAASDPLKGADKAAHSRYCMARLPLAGGTLTLHGLPEKATGDACDPPNLDSATLVRVEWAPARAVLSEIAEQRKADHKVGTFDLKREEIEKTKKQLEL